MAKEYHIFYSYFVEKNSLMYKIIYKPTKLSHFFE